MTALVPRFERFLRELMGKFFPPGLETEGDEVRHQACDRLERTMEGQEFLPVPELVRLASPVVIDAMRRMKVRRQELMVAEGQQPNWGMVRLSSLAPDLLPNHDVLIADMERSLQSAPTAQEEAARLQLQGMSASETAQLLTISEVQARGLADEPMRSLRDCLAAEGFSQLGDQHLRLLYQAATERSGPDAACPPAHVMVQALNAAAFSPERRKMVAHLARCSDCAQEAALLPAVQMWAEKNARQAPPPREEPGPAPEGRKRSLLPVAIVAGVAVLALALWFVVVGGGPPSGQDSGVQPPDHSVLHREPRAFSWPAVREAERYQVVLYDDSLTPLWTSSWANAANVSIPEAVSNEIGRGRPYYWDVSYSTQSGTKRLGRYTFRVR